MKFLINVFGKKSLQDQTKLNTMENMNILRTLGSLHRSHSTPNSFFQYDNSTKNTNTDNSVYNSVFQTTARSGASPIDDITFANSLDINSNLTFKHRDSLEGSNNIDMLDNFDFDNNNNDEDNNSSEKHILHRRNNSIDQTEDSGFSSCNCLNDDSHSDKSEDYCDSFDNEDSKFCGSSNCTRLFILPPIRRVRSYSMDSTSSDISDSTEHYSCLSSSLPSTYIFNHKDFDEKSSSFKPVQLNISSEGAKRRKIFKTRKHKVNTEIQELLQQQQPFSNCTSESSDLNNNWTDVSTTNLYSRLKPAPFRLTDVFQGRGLLSLIGCILYTLFLVFLIGFLTLGWSILKQCIGKRNLKELRDDVIESRYRREMKRAMSRR